MHVVCQTFWLQKDGLQPDEYEDAFAPKDAVDTKPEVFKCAVADGATEASFSRLWAQLLVEGYINDTPLPNLQAKWHEQVSGKQLAWYAEEKMASGSFAALVNLTLHADSHGKHSGKFEASAIGDSCLFHIHNDELRYAFPLNNWQQFNDSPLLISSNAENNNGVLEKQHSVKGTWHANDLFYLMTDAISAWFLKRQESNGDGVSFLAKLKTQEAFTQFAGDQRRQKDADGKPLLKNDDVTMMRIAIF
jgi:hypothetical protein